MYFSRWANSGSFKLCKSQRHIFLTTYELLTQCKNNIRIGIFINCNISIYACKGISVVAGQRQKSSYKLCAAIMLKMKIHPQ